MPRISFKFVSGKLEGLFKDCTSLDVTSALNSAQVSQPICNLPPPGCIHYMITGLQNILAVGYGRMLGNMLNYVTIWNWKCFEKDSLI